MCSSDLAVNQPGMQSSNFSPKASLRWDMNPDWSLTTSFGKAYRYPTVTELYQAVTSGGTVYTPNPNLRPEQSHSGELALEQVRNKGRLRLSLFQEDLVDALISQNSTISGTTVNASQTQNIDRIRSSGLELALEQGDALVRGLELAGRSGVRPGGRRRLLAGRLPAASAPPARIQQRALVEPPCARRRAGGPA